jgi:RNase H-fold protein (predicted Holliday junction resolvase)
MSQIPIHPTRIFALDPTTKGFGYAVFELPFRLVAWGLAHVSGEKESGAIARFEALLDQFRPDVVVLEDPAAPGSRRRPRVQKLLEKLVETARERGIEVQALPRLAVIECFSSPDERATKFSITKRLAETFPELAAKMPQRRKIYQSEDERIAIFDALALAVAYAMK